MDEIYKQVAEELGISEHIVETVLKHKYSWLRKQLKEMNNVAVLDNNFGTFYVPKSKVGKHVKYLETKECKTNEEEKKLQSDLTRYREMLKTATEYYEKKKLINKKK
jgi:nucleoid DNA-binding protein